MEKPQMTFTMGPAAQQLYDTLTAEQLTDPFALKALTYLNEVEHGYTHQDDDDSPVMVDGFDDPEVSWEQYQAVFTDTILGLLNWE